MQNKVNNKSKKTIIYLMFLLLSLSSVSVNAQCAMCRAALTSEGDTVKAEAINDGIVYLMVIPYILVAGIGFAVYRMKKNKAS
ncbi:hypothetical protein SAMN05444396_10224 [Flavobacterium segetis]|uniref:Uncharacterized protein n=2 Tax=Flavobacterium segetis TaxID=271157 RepID=A0A1M5EYS0_9FLAO|nr:hypothetical protein SAMN05444396_10224 [Flavobacterium segetis]